MATDCTSDPATPEEVSGSQVGSVEDEAPVHFPHPFHYRPDYDEFDHEQWRETPRTVGSQCFKRVGMQLTLEC